MGKYSAFTMNFLEPVYQKKEKLEREADRKRQLYQQAATHGSLGDWDDGMSDFMDRGEYDLLKGIDTQVDDQNAYQKRLQDMNEKKLKFDLEIQLGDRKKQTFDRVSKLSKYSEQAKVKPYIEAEFEKLKKEYEVLGIEPPDIHAEYDMKHNLQVVQFAELEKLRQEGLTLLDQNPSAIDIQRFKIKATKLMQNGLLPDDALNMLDLDGLQKRAYEMEKEKQQYENTMSEIGARGAEERKTWQHRVDNPGVDKQAPPPGWDDLTQNQKINQTRSYYEGIADSLKDPNSVSGGVPKEKQPELIELQKLMQEDIIAVSKGQQPSFLKEIKTSDPGVNIDGDQDLNIYKNNWKLDTGIGWDDIVRTAEDNNLTIEETLTILEKQGRAKSTNVEQKKLNKFLNETEQIKPFTG